MGYLLTMPATAVNATQPSILNNPSLSQSSTQPLIQGDIGGHSVQLAEPTPAPTPLESALNKDKLNEISPGNQQVFQFTDQHDIKINRPGTYCWKLASDLYTRPRTFESSIELEAFLEESYPKELDQAKTMEKQWGVEISRSANAKYPWKVTGDMLEQTFRFKSLDDMAQALEQGYLRRTAKHMAAAERFIRGRDIHNVTSITKMDTGPVLVIDGGDDLAVSLENSGLPRSLVLAVQSTALYPAFIGVVHKGWQGANDEYSEAREEYQELLESQQALKNEVRSLVTQELAIKEQLLNSTDNDDIQQQLLNLLNQHNGFKTNLLASVEPLLSAKSDGDQAQLKSTIGQLNALKAQLADHNQQVNEQLADKQPSPELQQLLTTLSSSQLFDPTSPDCHALIQQLSDYKANQDDKLAKFADTHIAAAFTESGLSGMYWGMVSFEARATSELLAGEAAQSFSSILSQMGDTFNVIGQAQMVIAGLTKAGLGIHEIKSLNEWLDQINTTQALDKPNSPELTKTKAIIDQFYRHQRNVTVAETLGNSVLTLGQLGMILGGPFGVGVSSVLYAGVGATIGGVAISQAAAQYSNKVFNVSDKKSAAEEAISQQTDPDAKPLDIIQQRIQNLYQLSQEQATPKVWLTIYQTIMKNPKADAFEVLAAAGKPYQKYDAEHSGHYRQLYRQALDNIKADSQNTIDIINQAKSLLQQKGSNTAFSAFVSQHIQQLQEVPWVAEQSDTAAGQIKQLFQFAEQQGFLKEFERRIVKRLVNENGYPLLKEQKLEHGPYIKKITANKSKRPWQIPNPIAPIINLGRLVKQLIKPVAHPKLLSNTLSIPMNWGKKDTSVYVFNRDRFLQDLTELKPNTPEASYLNKTCQMLFTEQLANDAKYWITKKANKVYMASGKDNVHVFEETMRHIGKQVLRDNVLRPIVHGVSEQVKLADLIAALSSEGNA